MRTRRWLVIWTLAGIGFPAAAPAQSVSRFFVDGEIGRARLKQQVPFEPAATSWGTYLGGSVGYRLAGITRLELAAGTVIGADDPFSGGSIGLGIETRGRHRLLARAGWGVFRTEVNHPCPSLAFDLPCSGDPIEAVTDTGYDIRLGYRLALTRGFGLGLTLAHQAPFSGEYRQRATAIFFQVGWHP